MCSWPLPVSACPLEHAMRDIGDGRGWWARREPGLLPFPILTSEYSSREPPRGGAATTNCSNCGSPAPGSTTSTTALLRPCIASPSCVAVVTSTSFFPHLPAHHLLRASAPISHFYRARYFTYTDPAPLHSDMYPLYVEAAFRNRGPPCSVGCRFALHVHQAVALHLGSTSPSSPTSSSHLHLPCTPTHRMLC